MSDTYDLFAPLPDELRSFVESLDGAPEGVYPDLPEWARTLMHRNSQLELDLDSLHRFGVESEDNGLMLSFEGTCLELFAGGTARAFSAEPKEEVASLLTRPRLSDYWDASDRAIEKAASRLADLDPESRKVSLSALRERVHEHTHLLSDEQLVQAAVNFADNLYKSACAIGWWDGDVNDYLEASARPFSVALTERGFRFQYLVDNAWSDMSRPTRLFPGWYAAAGVLFTCPQVLVANLAEQEPDTPVLDARLVGAARESCASAVLECQQEGLNFIHLDTDLAENSFEQALSNKEAEGVITMIRSEAPDPGTTIQVIPPAGIELS